MSVGCDGVYVVSRDLHAGGRLRGVAAVDHALRSLHTLRAVPAVGTTSSESAYTCICMNVGCGGVYVVSRDLHAGGRLRGVATVDHALRGLHTLRAVVLQGPAHRRRPDDRSRALLPAHVRQPRHQLRPLLPHRTQVPRRTQGDHRDRPGSCVLLAAWRTG